MCQVVAYVVAKHTTFTFGHWEGGKEIFLTIISPTSFHSIDCLYLTVFELNDVQTLLIYNHRNQIDL